VTAIEDARPRRNPRPAGRLSAVLRDLEAGEGARTSVGDIVGALRDRSFASLLVTFAAAPATSPPRRRVDRRASLTSLR